MPSPAHGPPRLAIDIGGTFTDLALERGDSRVTAKVLTTPAAPEEGVLSGIARILADAGVAAADVALVVHGTTLATNALIERRGARTALLTTEGHRDVLAMRNESRYAQYDLHIRLPEPLVPRHLRLPVPERLDHRGRVLLPLDEAAVRAHVTVLRDERIESVAIGFLHSFANPAHERRTAAILADALPHVMVSTSSDVSPEMREWERFSTTVANAYVQPLIAGYLARLERGLREAGLTAPLFLMLSGGGLTTVETACRFPVRLVESGPAGGALFAADLARRLDLRRVLSFDMGGTTAKLCLIDDFQPQTARTFEVARVGRFAKGSGLPLRIPVIEMIEIGAGGGSIAAVDGLGRITVGPQSAGAEPGPACYGRGGMRPTVTDANLLLGRYDPENFAGGTVQLDPLLAAVALARHVGAPLGLDAAGAAAGVVEIVDEAMAAAARVHAAESGAAPEGRVMIAFGGGGPVHAARIAEKIGIDRIVIPPDAGVGSAVGFLRAPVAFEVVRSFYQLLSALDVSALDALLEEMAREAEAVVEPGRLGAATTLRRIAFMRYVGQGHEIAVPVPDGRLPADAAVGLRRAYDAAYARAYDRPVPNADIEVLSYAVTVATAPDIVTIGQAPVTQDASAELRDILDPGSGVVTPWRVIARAALPIGAAGPLIVSEPATSTLVPPGWVVERIADGALSLCRSPTRDQDRLPPPPAPASIDAPRGDHP